MTRPLLSLLAGLALLSTAALPPTVAQDRVAYIEPDLPFSSHPAFRTPRGEVRPGTLRLPLLTWAADGVTVTANGGTAANPQSALARALGRPVELAVQDDFTEQIKDYISGRSPFLRGTLGMIALASEGLSALSPDLEPVIILQVSWSTGADGFVGRNLAQLSELKGRSIAVQFAGPHVDLVQTLLEDAGLKPGDVTLRFVRDLTKNPQRREPGIHDPANALRADSTLAGVAAIFPDILVLTAGGKVGTGDEDSVAGARPILTTRTASRVIADVYAVRRDYLTSNREAVGRFVAAHLAEQERFLGFIRAIRTDAAKREEFRRIGAPLAQIFLGDSGAVADYLVWVGADSELPGVAGNTAFFDDRNPVGLAATTRRLGSFFAGLRFVRAARPAAVERWDFAALAGGAAPVAAAAARPAFTSVQAVRAAAAAADSQVLFKYTFNFPAQVSEIRWSDYREVFDTLHEKVTRYGGAVVQLRGHADPFFYNFVRLKESRGEKTYEQRNPATNQFETRTLPAAEEVLNSANQLSFSRAHAMKAAYAAYLREFLKLSEAEVDLSRFDVKGMGLSDPIIPRPTTPQERVANMRGELVLIGVESEIAPEFGLEDLK